MMKRTSQYLVPLALGAMAVAFLFLAGCSREEAGRKPPLSRADPPSVYMKDANFRAALDAKGVERKELFGVREKLVAEMEKRVDAMRAKLRKAAAAVDDAAVKKELEKDPEWRSLVKRVEDLNEACEDNRKAATKLVAERLAPKK